MDINSGVKAALARARENGPIIGAARFDGFVFAIKDRLNENASDVERPNAKSELRRTAGRHEKSPRRKHARKTTALGFRNRA